MPPCARAIRSTTARPKPLPCDFTRALADRELTSKDYWKLVKPIIREIQNQNASLSIDDLIVEKPHSEESGVIAYYFDHTQGRTVKGMNIA